MAALGGLDLSASVSSLIGRGRGESGIAENFGAVDDAVGHKHGAILVVQLLVSAPRNSYRSLQME